MKTPSALNPTRCSAWPKRWARLANSRPAGSSATSTIRPGPPRANNCGTRGILGLIEPSELNNLTDDAGITIGEAMQKVGLPPENYTQAIRNDLDAFVELHIEQGRILF